MCTWFNFSVEDLNQTVKRQISSKSTQYSRESVQNIYWCMWCVRCDVCRYASRRLFCNCSVSLTDIVWTIKNKFCKHFCFSEKRKNAMFWNAGDTSKSILSNTKKFWLQFTKREFWEEWHWHDFSVHLFAIFVGKCRLVCEAKPNVKKLDPETPRTELSQIIRPPWAYFFAENMDNFALRIWPLLV